MTPPSPRMSPPRGRTEQIATDADVERVARAIQRVETEKQKREAAGPWPDGEVEALIHAFWVFRVEEARAALRAMGYVA